MKKQQFISILDRYLKNQATAEEQNLLHAYYHLFMADDDVLLLLKDEEKEKLKLQIKAGINARIGEIEVDVAAELVRKVRLWPGFRIKSPESSSGQAKMRGLAAAAAVAAIVFGVYFFNTSRHPDPERAAQQTVSGPQDIAPGKNGATITLANGKVIQLSDAKTGVVVGKDLKYNDGAAVQSGGPGPDKSGQALRQDDDRFNEMQTLTASTAKGQTYQFTLPDGTKVWLNADSKLEFPSSFVRNKTRFVKLSGEGYFEVAKNKAHPFKVATDKQIVEVLGTHFNINAYKDESNTKTTLLEGSVRVNEVTLKPSQQSILSGSDRITIKQVDVNESIGWKNGDFVFRNDDFKTLMRKVARWYNVEVVYDKSAPSDLSLLGEISRSKNISAILNIMEATGDVHFKIEGRRVIVTK